VKFGKEIDDINVPINYRVKYYLQVSNYKCSEEVISDKFNVYKICT
jgi:hypothetical protein